MKERKFRQIFGFHLGLELLDPLEAAAAKRERELATSFSSSLRFLSLEGSAQIHTHKCTHSSVVFLIFACSSISSGTLFSRSFLFPLALRVRNQGERWLKEEQKRKRKQRERGSWKKTSLVKVEKVAQATLD